MEKLFKAILFVIGIVIFGPLIIPLFIMFFWVMIAIGIVFGIIFIVGKVGGFQ